MSYGKYYNDVFWISGCWVYRTHIREGAVKRALFAEAERRAKLLNIPEIMCQCDNTDIYGIEV